MNKIVKILCFAVCAILGVGIFLPFVRFVAPEIDFKKTLSLVSTSTGVGDGIIILALVIVAVVFTFREKPIGILIPGILSLVVFIVDSSGVNRKIEDLESAKEIVRELLEIKFGVGYYLVLFSSILLIILPIIALLMQKGVLPGGPQPAQVWAGSQQAQPWAGPQQAQAYAGSQQTQAYTGPQQTRPGQQQVQGNTAGVTARPRRANHMNAASTQESGNPAAPEMKSCRNCRQPIPKGQVQCSYCGAVQCQIYCKRCHNPINLAYPQCAACGLPYDLPCGNPYLQNKG